MTPTTLRSVLNHFLDGSSGLDRLAADLRGLGPPPSGKIAGRVASLLDAIADVLQPGARPKKWSPTPAVVRGLALELLDTLPKVDTLPPLDVIQAKLDGLRARIARDYGIELVGLGGSIASGTSSNFSDIDVAATANRRLGLADMVGAIDLMHEALGWPVDLVMLDFAEPAFRQRFEKDFHFLPAVVR
jgi:predicted nucleotidyltransferase